jgi:hypothetical protein
MNRTLIPHQRVHSRLRTHWWGWRVIYYVVDYKARLAWRLRR